VGAGEGEVEFSEVLGKISARVGKGGGLALSPLQTETNMADFKMAEWSSLNIYL